MQDSWGLGLQSRHSSLWMPLLQENLWKAPSRRALPLISLGLRIWSIPWEGQTASRTPLVRTRKSETIFLANPLFTELKSRNELKTFMGSGGLVQRPPELATALCNNLATILAGRTQTQQFTGPTLGTLAPVYRFVVFLLKIAQFWFWTSRGQVVLSVVSLKSPMNLAFMTRSTSPLADAAVCFVLQRESGWLLDLTFPGTFMNR